MWRQNQVKVQMRVTRAVETEEHANGVASAWVAEWHKSLSTVFHIYASSQKTQKPGSLLLSLPLLELGDGASGITSRKNLPASKRKRKMPNAFAFARTLRVLPPSRSTLGS